MRIYLAWAAVIGPVLALTGWVILDARYRDDLHRAERRMDNYVRLTFAREQARPDTDYVSYPYITGDVYSRGFKKLKSEQVKVPSPLLTHKPRYVQLHFQVDDEGAFSSPQVPTGTSSEIAADQQKLTEPVLAVDRKLLARIEALFDKAAAKDSALRAVWSKGELFLARKAGARVQGFMVDWPALRADLQREIADIFPSATLIPGDQLATLPVALQASRVDRWTSAHTTVLGLCVLVIGACLVAARRQVAYIEKQRHFASLVTHELRGPLTTFRLYHELLDEGLVEQSKASEYFTTLRRESDRMAHMVENVIALSRLESGRAKLARVPITLAAILERAGPELRRCAPDLVVETGECDTVEVTVDAEAVGQILVNLVENAAKYGKPPIELTARTAKQRLEIVVNDQGEGPEGNPFTPYDRGKHAGTALRGLGLGLPLSRWLARDMGGDLRLDPAATFVLGLPARLP